MPDLPNLAPAPDPATPATSDPAPFAAHQALEDLEALLLRRFHATDELKRARTALQRALASEIVRQAVGEVEARAGKFQDVERAVDAALAPALDEFMARLAAWPVPLVRNIATALLECLRLVLDASPTEEPTARFRRRLLEAFAAMEEREPIASVASGLRLRLVGMLVDLAAATVRIG